jgi:DNA-binding NtrC family response regulator
VNATSHNNVHDLGEILIIDDDEQFATSIRELLLGLGYGASIALNGGAALAQLDRAPISVALIDYRLGHDSSLQLLQSIQAKAPHVVCVMLTALASAEVAVEALRLGAYDLLQKPITPEDLQTALGRWFKRSNFEQQRRRAHSSRVKSEGRFYDFTNSANDGFWKIDQHQRLQYASDQYGTLMGKSIDNIVGVSCTEFPVAVGPT